jgi:DnaJ-class molecular chaperone
MAVHAPALFYELPVRSFPPSRQAGSPRPAGGQPQRSAAERLRASPREGRTLEDVLSGAWEDLSAHRTATCPVCDGAMAPRYGAGSSAVGGRCASCRTELI